MANLTQEEAGKLVDKAFDVFTNEQKSLRQYDVDCKNMRAELVAALTRPSDPITVVPPPSDDTALQAGLKAAIYKTRTSRGKWLADVLDDVSVQNIVLQITEGSDVLDKLLTRHMTPRHISSVPKSGEFLGYGTRRGTYGYTEDQKCWTFAIWDNSLNGRVIESRGGTRYDNGFHFTHWLPMPKVPK